MAPLSICRHCHRYCSCLNREGEPTDRATVVAVILVFIILAGAFTLFLISAEEEFQRGEYFKYISPPKIEGVKRPYGTGVKGNRIIVTSSNGKKITFLIMEDPPLLRKWIAGEGHLVADTPIDEDRWFSKKTIYADDKRNVLNDYMVLYAWFLEKRFSELLQPLPYMMAPAILLFFLVMVHKQMTDPGGLLGRKVKRRPSVGKTEGKVERKEDCTDTEAKFPGIIRKNACLQILYSASPRFRWSLNLRSQLKGLIEQIKVFPNTPSVALFFHSKERQLVWAGQDS